ncbi:MAG: Fe-S cluster assembly protein SufD [Candidatus Kapaibacterium sp.]
MSKKYTTENIQQFVDTFDLFSNSLSGAVEETLGAKRSASIEHFKATGFPTTKHEEWKYTNMLPIIRNEFRPYLTLDQREVDEAFIRASGYQGDAFRLVFMNGHFLPEQSSLEGVPEGVVVTNLAAAIREKTDLVLEHIVGYGDSFEHSFATLNTAYLRDGAFVYIPKNVKLEKPVHILYLTTSTDQSVVTYPRTLLIAERGAEGSVIEEFTGKSGEVYLTNAVTEAIIGENAHLSHIKIQHESRDAFHIGASHAKLGRNANYFNNTLSFGGKIVRNDPWAVLEGEGGHAAVDGLYLVGEDQLIDNHTSIDHTVPNCTSHELYKGILRDNGHGVFNGKIFVQKDAQKTDSVQSNVNLLLSDEAEIDTKPQLEIYADDVKCTHGATIGRLDDTSIFYLRARGIGKDQAEQMLTYAFAAEVIEHIGDENIREYAIELLDARLDK